MPTFEVIVQTRHGEESVIVEAATRQAAYSAASHATGGAAVDSRQLYSPEEQEQNRRDAEQARQQSRQSTRDMMRASDDFAASQGRERWFGPGGKFAWMADPDGEPPPLEQTMQQTQQTSNCEGSRVRWSFKLW